jgi:hypothetical protein
MTQPFKVGDKVRFRRGSTLGARLGYSHNEPGIVIAVTRDRGDSSAGRVTVKFGERIPGAVDASNFELVTRSS